MFSELDLRRQQASVFIVATNRLRSFDAAVTRPGRFDCLLFVGTPNLSAREQRLRMKMSDFSSRVDGKMQDVICLQWTKFLSSNWERIRFLTFAENEVLINIAIEAAVSRFAI